MGAWPQEKSNSAYVELRLIKINDKTACKIDDTTGQVLAIDDASGKYRELIEFNDLQKQLQDLQKHGYQITSNTFNNQLGVSRKKYKKND